MSYRTVHLDDLEAIPGPGSLTWRPVRATLGIRAFGTNAYTAGEAGDDVVEPHTENGDLAHEELYFVARGRAVFTIDGESFDAPAGTYVFLPDPDSHRHAVAAEPGTTVLSFGGPATFTPSAWEWSFRAAARHDDPEEAKRILAEGFELHPESPSLFYELACVEAVAGNLEAARAALDRAIELEPELEKVAATDDDLAALRS
jgi:tetratricopeptide (TPR) repeat protein